jgi:hypothetical protein
MHLNEGDLIALRLNKELIMHLSAIMHNGSYDKAAEIVLGMTPANLGIWIYCRSNGVIVTEDPSEEKDFCFIDNIIAAKFASLPYEPSRQSFCKY